MNQEHISGNNANGAGTYIGEGPSFGRCPMDEQRRPGCYSATANRKGERINWRLFNKVLMECCYKSELERRGFMKRMKRNWGDKGLFEVPEQRLLDQVRVIRLEDMILHSWVLKSLQFTDDIKNVLEKSMTKLKVQLTKSEPHINVIDFTKKLDTVWERTSQNLITSCIWMT